MDCINAGATFLKKIRDTSFVEIATRKLLLAVSFYLRFGIVGVVASNSIIACIDTFPFNLNAQDNFVYDQWVAGNGRVQVYAICSFFQPRKIISKSKEGKDRGAETRRTRGPGKNEWNSVN